jgi:FkbM family methyltransferase
MIHTYNTKYGIMSVYGNDRYFFNTYNIGKHWDEDIISNILYPYIKQSSFILDIGSHIGSHTIAYCSINNEANIICFEPQKQLYNILVKNIEDNSYTNRVTVFNKAVGNKNRYIEMSESNTVCFTYDNKNEYNKSLEYNMGALSIGKNGEKTEMITIDSLLLDKCDFIKIDVEGAEPLVLVGAENTIKKYKPIIWYEFNSRRVTQEMLDINEHINNFKLPHEILISWGYNISQFGDDYLAIPNTI